MAPTRKRSTGSVLLSRKRSLAVAASATSAAPTSAKGGRDLIRKHHTLQKQLAQAHKKGDEPGALRLRQEIEANGGLERYQKASVRTPAPRCARAHALTARRSTGSRSRAAATRPSCWCSGRPSWCRG